MIKRRLLKSHALIGQGLEEGYQSILLCVGEAQWMNLAWDPPPSLTSGLYTRDYNDVKALGALTNSTRTPEQTELAYFWFANYLVVWNEALRNIAGAQVFNIGESARLFALANMAMADAVITAWNTKRQYVFWRPITAIQEGDNDGNRHTAGDLSWKPLFDTPPYPDYTSGANNVTGAVTRMLRLFFGRNEMTFSVTTTNPLPMQKTRTYHRFTEAASNVVIARVYEGIHFLFADTKWHGVRERTWPSGPSSISCGL